MPDNRRVTIPDVFAAAGRRDPARPLLTYYDDATGERTELSHLTMTNWVNKTANLIVDEQALAPGDVAAVDMPPHWLTAAVMLGCWTAGLGVAHEAARADVGFVAADRLDSAKAADAAEVYAVETAPLAIGLRDAEARSRAASGAVRDFLVDVRGHGDFFTPVRPVTADMPALTAMPRGPAELSHDAVLGAARQRAAEQGVGEGARILLGDEVAAPLDWLLVPLVVGGSVVLCRNSGDTDLASRAAAERATPIAPAGRG